MNNPEYVVVKEKKYKIDTDFRTAIECNAIAEDENIGDYERCLAIIYKLYGDEGLNDRENHEELIKKAIKYLTLNKENKETSTKEQPDMDFIEDMDYIYASFMSDYKIDLTNKKMHWWSFYNLLSGLSNSEMGNCCILNRIRNLRNYDLSTIKDNREREKMAKAKASVMLKKNKKESKLTAEQEESMRKLDELLGLNRKE